MQLGGCGSKREAPASSASTPTPPLAPPPVAYLSTDDRRVGLAVTLIMDERSILFNERFDRPSPRFGNKAEISPAPRVFSDFDLRNIVAADR